MKRMGLAIVALAAGRATAQSVNVDFDRPNGIGAGGPATSYGAASGQTGLWNVVTPSTAGATVSLHSLSGLPAGVTMTHEASSGSSSGDYGAGDFEKLMGDYAYGMFQNGSIEVAFDSLDAGFYSVFVYGGLAPWDAYYSSGGQDIPHRTIVAARADSQPGVSASLQGVSANALVRGTNFGRLWAGISAGRRLHVTASADLANLSARTCMNGVQLVKWPTNRVHVRTTATGDGSGRNWDNATSDLNDAIRMVAGSNGTLAEVWVAGGTYKPTAGSDRTASFRLLEGVKVYGGFAGTETSRDQRDIWGRTTVLSGEIGTSSISDNVYHVVRADGTSGSTVLDGFNISRGFANASGHTSGAAIYAEETSAHFVNLFIVNNHGSAGGAVDIAGSRNSFVGPRFVKCDFRGNSSGHTGGALRYDGALANSYSPEMVIASCRFIENDADSSGGGVFVGGGDVRITNSLFTGNASGQTGGAVAMASSDADTSLFVLSCTIANNSASIGAGGIAASGGDLTVRNSILWSNRTGGPLPPIKEIHAPGITPTIQYSCILAWPNPNSTTITANPRFVDADGANNIAGDIDDDYTLGAASPCLDAGNNQMAALDFGDLDGDNLLNEWQPVDVAGNDRFIDDDAADTGFGPAPIMDMGCYERQRPPCPADFNGDGFLDFFDYDDFVTCFESGGCPAGRTADFNGDAFVDFFDYDDFVTAFEAGC